MPRSRRGRHDRWPRRGARQGMAAARRTRQSDRDGPLRVGRLAPARDGHRSTVLVNAFIGVTVSISGKTANRLDANLLRAPVQLELGLHQRPELVVEVEPAAARPVVRHRGAGRSGGRSSPLARAAPGPASAGARLRYGLAEAHVRLLGGRSRDADREVNVGSCATEREAAGCGKALAQRRAMRNGEQSAKTTA